MINIIDFDHTLFDTYGFRRRALPEFLGQTVGEFDAYYQVVRSHNRGLYSVMAHIDNLATTAEKKAGLIKALPDFLRRVQTEYLLPGVLELLLGLRKRNENLILLTRGDLAWQFQKIDNLEIGHRKFASYFDKVIYTEGHKHENPEVLMYRGQSVRIINDNARESRDLLGILGEKAEVFLVRSEHSDNIKHEFILWPDLPAVLAKILKQDATNS